VRFAQALLLDENNSHTESTVSESEEFEDYVPDVNPVAVTNEGLSKLDHLLEKTAIYTSFLSKKLEAMPEPPSEPAKSNNKRKKKSKPVKKVSDACEHALV
jgi:hypothetical protein